ncbi:Programmed cell death protein 2 C-terminal domain-containing protein [Plasmodiophora brassicae]|uniref:Programmed cell death protein 2 C-terminal domain-containing protein n=1 Tax=Plasmodiophora brassicae TaxID=37360 RepID=A0A0G4IP25_PLABS|nr:hypothetical protein PBRA_005544 [Plasmodiophora brassicae]
MTVLLVPSDYRADTDEVDWRQSIAGGSPASHESVKASQASCRSCGSRLSLLVQVFAPLPDADRTVYVLTCLNRACSNNDVHAKRFCERYTERHHPDVVPSDTRPVQDDDWGVNDGDSDDASLDDLLANQMTHLTTRSADAERSRHRSSSTYAFYLVDVEEPSAPRSADLSHELELLQRYENDCAVADADDAGAQPEEYEVVGDARFHKFLKRVSRDARQCVRYDFLGAPLWMTDSVPRDCIPDCAACGARLVFEMQLMPHLITALRLPMSWGTIAVYVCPTSCRRDELVDEFAFVQAGY